MAHVVCCTVLQKKPPASLTLAGGFKRLAAAALFECRRGHYHFLYSNRRGRQAIRSITTAFSLSAVDHGLDDSAIASISFMVARSSRFQINHTAGVFSIAQDGVNGAVLPSIRIARHRTIGGRRTDRIVICGRGKNLLLLQKPRNLLRAFSFKAKVVNSSYYLGGSIINKLSFSKTVLTRLQGRLPSI